MRHPKSIYQLIAIALMIIVMWLAAHPSQAAVPASFTWRSSGPTGFGVLDSDNATILETGDLVQFIWAGSDGLIDSPQSDGQPGDDDQLLSTGTVQNDNLPPTLANKGLVLPPIYSFDTNDSQNGGTIYMRAWNDSILSNATDYGDSSTGTLTDDGELNAATWNTNTAFTPLAATLASFEATPQENHISITWQTVSELNNLGFTLYRSTSPDQPSEQLNNQLIPSQAPGSGSGSSYAWQDDDVEEGTTYYYWLEDIETSGVTTLHAPVSATLNQTTAVRLTTLDAPPTSQTLPRVLATLALIALLYLLVLRRRQHLITQ